MNPFQNWFARHARRRRACSPRPSFRPQVEGLEDRRLLNVSSVFDAAGNRTVFAVYDNNSLIRYDTTGAHHLADNVLRVHGYRDTDGSVGVIVIYTSFAAFDYDHLGGHFLGNNIVDAAKAYDRAGHIRFDVTYSVGAEFHTFEYTSTSAQEVAVPPGIIAVLIHPFQDQFGNIGAEVSYFDSVTTCTLIEYDSAGARFLAHDAVADKTWDPTSQHFTLDVVYISNNAFEYTESSAIFLGNNIPI